MREGRKYRAQCEEKKAIGEYFQGLKDKVKPNNSNLLSSRSETKNYLQTPSQESSSKPKMTLSKAKKPTKSKSIRALSCSCRRLDSLNKKNHLSSHRLDQLLLQCEQVLNSYQLKCAQLQKQNEKLWKLTKRLGKEKKNLSEHKVLKKSC